jgi:hypothetical protein
MTVPRREVVSRCGLLLAIPLAVALAGCRTPEDDYVRGHGLKVAAVTPAQESQIVEAAMRAAFDIEPELNLRMSPHRLSRTALDTGTNPVPSALVKSLRDRGLVSGTCEPVRSAPRNTPHCSTNDAGYIIRTSEVFALSRDTTEVYFAAEKYGAQTGQKPEALRFEKVYQLVKADERWRVAREGRLHER